jgi:chromosomal replication initiation ATPase DnaA
MSTFAEQLRGQASDLRAQAAQLDAIAAELDGNNPANLVTLSDPRAHAIAVAVCDQLHMPLAMVLSPNRMAHVVTVRDICAHALRCLLNYSLQRIAHTLGWDDHATVSAALRRVRERRQMDKHFAPDLERAMKAAHAALAKIEEIAA